MLQSRFKKNRLPIIGIAVLFLCLTIGWILYTVFGHQLVEAMYEGRSIGFLNRIIDKQTTHPVRDYLEVADKLFLAGVGFFLFFGSLVLFELKKLLIRVPDKRFFKSAGSVSWIEYLVLFGSVVIFSVSPKGFYFYRSEQLWLFCAGVSALYFIFKIKAAQEYTETILRNILSSKLYIFIFSIGFLLAYFIQCFPLKEWGSYIAVDDYSGVLVYTKQGLNILKQGGYFGWDSSFLGGRFTAASATGANLIHFLLPLSFVGLEKGFHLMLLIFFLGFPLLCYYYVKACCKIDNDSALVALLIASFFVLTYFKDLLAYGMVAAFIGIDLLILSLILCQRLREGKRYSFFYLTLTLSLSFYTHPGISLYAIILTVIILMAPPDRKQLKHIFYLGCFLFVISLPFLIYKFKYSTYLILDNYNYIPAKFSLKDYPLGIMNNFLEDFKMSTFRVELYPLYFLPILMYMFLKKAWKKEVIFALFIPIFLAFIPGNLSLVLTRIKFLTPFLLSVSLTGFLVTNYKKKHFVILLLGLFLSFMFFCPGVVSIPQAFKHIKPGLYNKPLVEVIKTLGGRYVAVENNQHWKHAGDKVVPDFHWLPVLQLETNRLLFSNPHEGYDHTPYRANSFDGGFFRGKVIDEWAIEDINKVLLKWGVKYLVMWNEKTKGYFNNYPQFYETVWKDTDWVIFKFRDSDIRSAVVDGNGKAEVIDNDYFEKRIILSDVAVGSKTVVRSNYFPAWKAYYNNKEIPLLNFEGQIGFIAPASGDYIIKMNYPRYAFFNVLAFCALMTCGFLSYRRILP